MSVNPVWLAAYTRRAAELSEGRQLVADDIFDLPADIRQEAVLHADLVINKTQPGNILYYQPQYMKNGKGLIMKILTMFQTPASVIFQQLFFDLPRKFGQGGAARKQAIWGLASFITTWLVMGFLKDDEKERWLEGDAEERIRKFLSYLIGSRGFAGNLPIIGNIIGDPLDAVIKGEGIRSVNMNVWPLANQSAQVYNDLRRGEDAVVTALDALGMLGLAAGAGTAQTQAFKGAYKNSEDLLQFVLRSFSIR